MIAAYSVAYAWDEYADYYNDYELVYKCSFCYFW